MRIVSANYKCSSDSDAFPISRTSYIFFYTSSTPFSFISEVNYSTKLCVAIFFSPFPCTIFHKLIPFFFFERHPTKLSGFMALYPLAGDNEHNLIILCHSWWLFFLSVFFFCSCSWTKISCQNRGMGTGQANHHCSRVSDKTLWLLVLSI